MEIPPRMDPAPQVSASPLGLRLTSLGENFEPSWHNSSERFLYVTQRRPSHQSAQVYEYQLNSYRERRVTFNNSETRFPAYTAQGLIYSSLTDALKELPEQFYPQLYQVSFGPFEIYTSDLFGNQLKRETTDALPDTEPLGADNEDFVFVKHTKDHYELRSQKSGTLHRSKNLIHHLVLTPNREQIFFMDGEQATLYKVKSKRFEKLPQPSGRIQSLSYSRDLNEIFFVSENRVTALRLQDSCLSESLAFPEAVQEAIISPNGAQFLLVSNLNGARHIYLYQAPTFKFNCETKEP
ncbi:MAG: hypothetical protein ACK5P6_04075 [Pseudobdellovibrionaceae bacterium]